MEYRIPKKGEIYRHFKGNLYEIVMLARDSETLEEKVVYKEVEGDAAYVRSLPMFVSYVDRAKYPDVAQKFRFELVKDAPSEKMVEADSNETKNSVIEEHSMILEFLDIRNADTKIRFLENRKESMTEEFITLVAQSLDFVENAGTLPDRYDAILNYLKTVARYESGRLR